MPSLNSNIKKIPETPGVYIFRNKRKEMLYIGKAANLKRRVSSYFQKAHDSRIEEMVRNIEKIDYKKTDSVLEALMFEAELIKKHQPPYNILQKDDKSFLYVEFTKEKFPRLLLTRGKNKSQGSHFGPFLYAGAIREGLRILRKIFPWNLHPQSSFQCSQEHENKKNNETKPCFDAQVGLCPGTCIGAISKADYKKIIRKIRLFFLGKKKQIIQELRREMGAASKNLEFERASIIKRQIFSLKHIQDVALINAQPVIPSACEESHRIEGYDVSNISGTSAVGSMVVFVDGKPDKNQYRKFKIPQHSEQSEVSVARTPSLREGSYFNIHPAKGQGDTGMLKEVLERRLKHKEWPLPDLIVVDGGKGQVGAATSALAEAGLKIPVVGIAKGPKRKKNEFFGKIQAWTDEDGLIKVRDEAHRFAISYHKHLRGAPFRKRT
ncbi:MAG: GIY-YIG nuclease family protein [Nanoarchaeota archaeon]|nr:GIY-YIG nuclease family protein [Nanoarchaeota archaeon]